MDNALLSDRIDYVGKLIEIIRNRWKNKSAKNNSFSEVLGSILLDRREKDLISEQILSILFSTKFVSLLTESEIGSNKGFFLMLPPG